MSRRTPRIVGVLLSAATVTALTGTPAHAEQGLIDGGIETPDQSCSWSDGVTSDTPPNTLTVDRSTINAPDGSLSCEGSTSAELNNDPTVTFDDDNGTVTADLLDVSVTELGLVTCRYRAENLSAQRDGDTRTYQATAEIPLYEGGPLCPDPASVTATFTFH